MTQGDISTAVILAAGEGRRLRPITARRPKPMIPVANTPILEYIVEAVADAGIDRIVLVVGYRRERIQTHFGDGAAWDVAIDYVVQKDRLGTGHALLQARDHLPAEFVVLNGDRIITSPAINAVIETQDTTPDGAVATTRVATPRRYGVVQTVDGLLQAIDDQPRGGTVPNRINAGVYRLRDTVFPVLDSQQPGQAGEVSLPTALTTLAAQAAISTVRYEGPWRDLSQLWDLPAMSEAVLEAEETDRAGQVHETAVVNEPTTIGPGARIGAHSTIRGGTSVGANATIGANTVIEQSVIFPDATIEDGAIVKNAIVGAGATVSTNVAIPSGTADLVVDGTAYENIDFGGAIGDHASLGCGVVCHPGTRVGDAAEIGPGSVLSGKIPANTIVQHS